MRRVGAEKGSDLLSVEEAAAAFGLGSATIWRWIAAKRLTAHRRAAGRPRVFVDRRELRKLLEPKPARKRKGGP